MEEICRIEAKSDFNHNRLGRSSSQSSLDSMDQMSIVSDTELLHRSSPYSGRPRSADVHNSRNMPHRASYHGYSSLPHHHSSKHSGHSRHFSRSMSAAVQNGPNKLSGWGNGLMNGDSVHRPTQYVAVTDYDPSMFSQSGHPRLELSLKEGDVVLVTGQLLESGYIEGEVKGRVGLVPISYLQPVSTRRSVRNHRAVPEHLNASPERIAQLYNSLNNVHSPDTHGRSAYICNFSIKKNNFSNYLCPFRS